MSRKESRSVDTSTGEAQALRARIRELEDRLARTEQRAQPKPRINDQAIEAFRSAKICAWHWSKETQRIEYFPNNAGDILGLPPGKLPETDKANLDLVHPDDRERIAAAFDHANETGEAYRTEYRVLLQDGSSRHLRETSEPVFDDNGIFVGNVGTWQDITNFKEADEAHRKTQEILRLVTDAIPSLISYCDVRYRYIFANKAYEHRFGIPSSDIVGMRIDEVLGTTAYERLKPHIDRAYAGEVVSYIDDAVDRHGNRWVTLETRLPHMDASGAVMGIVTIAHDITELKQTEEALRQSESRLSQAATLAKLGHWIWDEVEDKIVYCSDEMAHILGFASGEDLLPYLASPNAHLEWIHPDDRARYLEAIGSPDFARQGMDIEYRILTRSGAIRHVRELCETETDAAGNLVRSKGTLQDITKEKQTEWALRESEERYALAVRGSNDGVWDWDIERGQVHLSRRVKEIIGSNDHREQLPHAEVLELVHPEDKTRFRDTLIRHLKGKSEYFTCEFRVLAEDGSERWVLDRGYALRGDDGRAYRMAGSVSDITERRQTEEKLRHSQKMEAVGQLTGGIAHDFNNILGIVLGNLDLAREKLACGPTADHIDQAIKAAERGAELTDRLLAFARRQTLKPSLLRVDENLRDMKDLLRQAVGSDISVQIETPPQLWASYTDPVQFENAILNLALNGRDAMPDGGNLDIVAVNTVLESDFAQSLEIVPGEYVLIDITDSGAGMTDDVRRKAFEPFFTTKQVGKGSGLGLSMVQGFVQQSGGAVRLISDEAHGTTVRVYLPRAREPALDEFEVISDHGPAIRNRPRVLVLVRDGSLRAFVREILDSLDCEARFASGQETALDGSDADAGPDLVLTDLPSNELAREEGLLGRPCGSWPIIYVTGEEIQPDHLTHPAEPGASFLQKPLEASALSRAVREALARH